MAHEFLRSGGMGFMKIPHIICTRNRIVDGINEAWKLWLATTHTGSSPPPAVLERLEREFQKVAEYIRFRLNAGDTPSQPAPHARQAGQAGGEKPSPKRAQGAKG